MLFKSAVSILVKGGILVNLVHLSQVTAEGEKAFSY